MHHCSGVLYRCKYSFIQGGGFGGFLLCMTTLILASETTYPSSVMNVILHSKQL